MQDTRTVTMAVGEDVVTLTYRPSGITPETEDRLEAFVKEQKVGQSMIALLLDTLVSWDITDDKGKTLPINDAQLRKLPLALLGQMVRTITEDMRPNAPSGGTSAATS